MFIYIMVFMGGFAALSWEILWQIKASLALGSSAWGTAVILSITMGGMCAGSLGMGKFLNAKVLSRPLLIYGALEALIGFHGLFLISLFSMVEGIDNVIFQSYADIAKLTNVIGITIALIFPALCMGATIPVLGLVARQNKTSLSLLYGLNTIGAALGVLTTALAFIPALTLSGTILLISALNFSIGFIALIACTFLPKSMDAESSALASPATVTIPFSDARVIVFVTGLCTFMLEISWFRLITAAFHSTTDAFAIMLAVFLLALGSAGASVYFFRALKKNIGVILFIAAALVLIATPAIERYDYLIGSKLENPYSVLLRWFVLTLYILGPPVFFLGLCLPWVLNDYNSTKQWSLLYALNTFGAIIGAICAAWFLLPFIGTVKTALLAGTFLLCLALYMMPKAKRPVLGIPGLLLLAAAFAAQSGIGTQRVQGHLFNQREFKVLESFDGPEATVTAIEYPNGGRGLMIDGFLAADQTKPGEEKSYENYMAWMGHLPMLLHPDPKHGLVICMGTGQTLNGVRKENPQTVDIVDINPNVFKFSHYFTTNEDVLNDPRVSKTVMDGRAFIRRTQKTFDIITLEPMPPSFAGVNALYSHEFYALAHQKMSDQGVIAQWIPFHLIAPHYTASIVKTFIDVFPNAILWIDPLSETGILIGSKDENIKLGSEWPGYDRNTAVVRSLDQETVKKAVYLDQGHLKTLAESGEIVNDNNQILAYGEAVLAQHSLVKYQAENMKILKALKSADAKEE